VPAPPARIANASILRRCRRTLKARASAAHFGSPCGECGGCCATSPTCASTSSRPPES
jgi:hypothetical protein